MDLQQILDDSKTFADDIKFTLNGQEVSLGDLRGLSAKKQKELSDKIADTERRRAEVMDLATKAAEIKSNLEAQLANATRQPVVESDFDKDPFWAPVRERDSARTKDITELKSTIGQINNALANIVKVYTEDRWQNQFASGKDRLKDAKYKDFTYEKVRDYAAEHKLFDSNGLPSVTKAIDDITRVDEREAAIRAAREEGIREGVQRGRLSTQSRPTSATGPKAPEKSVVADKGLEGLGDDVASDPELMKMLSDLGAVSPEDLVQ